MPVQAPQELQMTNPLAFAQLAAAVVTLLCFAMLQGDTVHPCPNQGEN